VTDDGALYFSAAGNAGNFDTLTSSTWEGDFVNGGAAGPPVNGKGGSIHLFGSQAYDNLVQGGQDALLSWSDPMGGSANDYDLYVLDSAGENVVASSVNVQDGSQDPIELIWGDTQSGERLVVVLASGAPRFLHVNSYGGRLAQATSGNIFGHRPRPTLSRWRRRLRQILIQIPLREEAATRSSTSVPTAPGKFSTTRTVPPSRRATSRPREGLSG